MFVVLSLSLMFDVLSLSLMFVVLSLSLMFDVLCLSLMFDIQCPNLMLDCQILHEYYKNNYTFCLFFIGIIESQKRYGIETFIFIFST